MKREMKIWPEHFTAVASGDKTVELRQEDDRQFDVGDVLVLREWISHNTLGLGIYTGRQVSVKVTHVLRDEEGRWLQPGVVALSIRVIPGEETP